MVTKVVRGFQLLLPKASKNVHLTGVVQTNLITLHLRFQRLLVIVFCRGLYRRVRMVKITDIAEQMYCLVNPGNLHHSDMMPYLALCSTPMSAHTPDTGWV
jgi:hypothetical protein